MADNQANQPNVLLVNVDQWAGRLLGAGGHPVIQTPTIDAIARTGVRFTRAYSECPICIPARRTLMTGTTTRTHGDRIFGTANPMPNLPTIAQSFRNGGYQAFAVGKIHVYPPCDRIGFDDVMLAEEGRPHLGTVDDHDLYLADRGFAGKQFTHGMNNNDYMHREWHLPEDCHVTNWTTSTMARVIKRRDPTRPAFWYLSYTHPHPPLVPLATYMNYYRQFAMEPALSAPWAEDFENLPHAIKLMRDFYPGYSGTVLDEIRRAFYALCTHIDHQLRVIIGTLREEGVADNTIIMFMADHGDMLGDFGLFAKRTYYERSANVPMILAGLPGDRRIGTDRADDRLVGLQDIMPTLLSLCGLPVPETCEGLNMVGERTRSMLYADCLESAPGSRMLHDGRHKLIWYPAGNSFQLFDLESNPMELNELSELPEYQEVRRRLTDALAAELYGADIDQGWIKDGKLVGFDPGPFMPNPDRSLHGQRGMHYPTPPQIGADKPVGFV
ncbi:MAG: sulfatase-like hydrolase/transferase [Pseudomonadota bacterium]